MNGIVVSVDFADLLRITLPRSFWHFDKVLVVSTERDTETAAVVDSYKYADVSLFCTDAFYRNGAHFNKGLALEEGLDVLGREGCMVIFDADIVMPCDWQLGDFDPGCLYSPRRRLCVNPSDWGGTKDWSNYRRYHDREYAGYFQLFHADDPVLKERPWYGVDWKTAAGCDSDFQARWPEEKRIRPDFEVLHLGPPAENWCGRVTPMLDGTTPPEAEDRLQTRREVQRNRRRGYAAERLAKQL